MDLVKSTLSSFHILFISSSLVFSKLYQNMEHRGSPKGLPLSIKVVQTGPKFYPDSTSGDGMKPDDDFYPAWDKFLAKTSNRTTSTSTLAKRVARTDKAAHKDDNGLRSHESISKSYNEAREECKAKVRAIVAECTRLNQKYTDRHFDLEDQEADCIYPLGNSTYEAQNPRPSAVKRIEVGLSAFYDIVNSSVI